MNMLIFIYLCAVALAYALPERQARNAPAPLSFPFTVAKKIDNISAREFWAQKRGFKRDSFSERLTNMQDIFYMMNIYLGSNKLKSYVIIDTGSSDLWVPSTDYSANSSTTSQNTNQKFGIQYIDGSITRGDYVLDSFQFENSPVVPNLQFAVSDAQGPGVLGIGNRAEEAVRDKYDNLPWALQKAGITPKASYSMYLGQDKDSGVVIFGGVDTEKYEGCLTKYPVHDSGKSLTIEMKSVVVDGTNIDVASPYYIDSGTSLCFVGQKIFNSLGELIESKVVTDNGVDYRVVSCTQPADKYLQFDFGANTISISYADMIVQNDDGSCLLGMAHQDGHQLLGSVFMRSAYVYFDLTDQTISLGQGKHSDSSNIVSA